MSERDPFEQLRDLIDEPVAPRTAFADELRSRLMRELSASGVSREEHSQPMDASISPRPPLAFPIEPPRRIRPMVVLELAAAAIIVIGLAATLGRGWFGNDPETPTSLPAAALQGNGTPNPETTQAPTVEPTVAPPGDMAGTIWVLPGDGDIVDFGGLLVEDETVYRLIATSDFVGVQAIDGAAGTVKWQQAHQWSGDLFALEEDTLYFDGGNDQLVAVDAETGAEQWRAQVEGNPVALDEEDGKLFVLLDSDFVTALDGATGDQLWVAQGAAPQNPAGGSASMPAIGKIAVDNGVVAAVSTYGVLSGFDVQTGTELWSHEGFDAATVSIATENDRFVVIDSAGPESAVGFGIGVDGPVTAMVPGTPGDATSASLSSAEAGVPGQGCGVVFGEAGASSAAVGVGTSGTKQGDAPDGTPEAGVAASAATGMIVRVQGIDPRTGEIVWAQQSLPGAMAVTVQDSGTAGVPADICAVDVESGSVTSVSASGSPGAGAASMEEGHVAVGSVSSGVFTPAQAGDDGQIVSIGIGAGAIAGLDQPAIAIAADEDGIYLQLQDGSLVKIHGGQTQGEAGHQEDSDDDHTEGTTESGDND
jgi:hypothetical protein